VRFTLKSAMVTYLNHTPCEQSDPTDTKAKAIILYYISTPYSVVLLECFTTDPV